MDCSNIEKTDPRYFNNWRESKLICVERYKGDEYSENNCIGEYQ